MAIGMHNVIDSWSSCTKKSSIGQVRLVVAYTKLFTTQICMPLLVLKDQNAVLNRKFKGIQLSKYNTHYPNKKLMWKTVNDRFKFSNNLQ